MESVIKKLGKTSVTVEKDYHSSKKEYNKLTVVEEEGAFKTYLSRKPVPVGIELTNREYWIPFSGVLESIVFDYLKFKKDYASGKAIEDNAIITRHILNRSIERIKIALKAISEEEIDDNAIIERTIKDRNITTNKIAKENIITEHFAKKSVITNILADYVITAIKLADDSVTTRSIVNKSVTQEKLANNSVNESKIVDKTIINSKIADDTIELEKLSTTLQNIINSVTNVPEDLIRLNEIDNELKKLIVEEVVRATNAENVNTQLITKEVARLDKTDNEIKEKLNDKTNEINVAKEEALQAIAENEQSAITNFNAQRVIPEMLSESTKQLIEASGGGTITNLADDEDITSVNNGTGSNVLKFADKTYNANNFSGKGYKILRKNVVDGKNVLTQAMINEENTVYEVRYDFDLNGNEITIPNGCLLKFNGGSISKGILNGIIENEYLYPEWFGAISNNEKDCYEAIQNCINLKPNKIIFRYGIYKVLNSIITDVNFIINKDATLLCDKEVDTFLTLTFDEQPFGNYITGGGNIDANYNANKCMVLSTGARVNISNLYIKNAKDTILTLRDNTELYCNCTISNIKVYNKDLNYKNIIGIKSNINDSIFTDVTAIYCNIGIDINQGGNVFDKIHIWTKKELYENSIGLNINTSGNLYNNIIIDGINIGIKLNNTYSSIVGSNLQVYTGYATGTIPSKVIIFEKEDTTSIINVISGLVALHDEDVTVLSGKENESDYINLIYTDAVTFNNNKLNINKLHNVPTRTPILGKKFIGTQCFANSTYFKQPIWYTGEKWITASFYNAACNKSGNNDQRPTEDINVGFMYYNTQLIKPQWWNGWKWIDANGYDSTLLYSGTTAQRPTNIKTGFQYFDTTINKPIWFTGTEWVDSTGVSV